MLLGEWDISVLAKSVIHLLALDEAAWTLLTWRKVVVSLAPFQRLPWRPKQD